MGFGVHASCGATVTQFTATDGTIITFQTRPTLASVVELFNFVYEMEVNRGPMVTLEETEAAATGATAPEGASRGIDAAGEPSGSEYRYTD